MPHQDNSRQTQGRGINATEREGLVDKIGFMGTVAPSEATSIKVATFLQNSRLHGLGLMLDVKPIRGQTPSSSPKLNGTRQKFGLPGWMRPTALIASSR
jgi:hypothetical protein